MQISATATTCSAPEGYTRLAALPSLLPRAPHSATLTSIHVAVQPPKARLVNGHHLQVLVKTCRDALHPGAQVNFHPAEPAAERDIRVNLLQEGRGG